MKNIYFSSKQLLAVFAIFLAITVSGQSVKIGQDTLKLDPESDTTVTAIYCDAAGDTVVNAHIVWHTEPGYLGKVNKNGTLSSRHPGEGYLFAKYRGMRDSVVLIVNGPGKDDDDDDTSDYPKVKIIPSNIRVEISDSVELRAFYVDTSGVKTDTSFTWMVEPSHLGEFPDSSLSMLHTSDLPGSGIVIASLGDLADTAKIIVYES